MQKPGFEHVRVLPVGGAGNSHTHTHTQKLRRKRHKCANNNKASVNFHVSGVKLGERGQEEGAEMSGNPPAHPRDLCFNDAFRPQQQDLAGPTSAAIKAEPISADINPQQRLLNALSVHPAKKRQLLSAKKHVFLPNHTVQRAAENIQAAVETRSRRCFLVFFEPSQMLGAAPK